MPQTAKAELDDKDATRMGLTMVHPKLDLMQNGQIKTSAVNNTSDCEERNKLKVANECTRNWRKA